MSRKHETKRRLQTQALRLFSSRGFDNVTVEEVARAAGVSHMTFFRHFPTKEAVVMDDPFDPLLAEVVRAQDPTLGPFERVRKGVLDAFRLVEGPDDEMTKARVELAASHPSLRAKVSENNQRTADVIVEALVGSGADEFASTVAVGAVLGALTAGLFAWAEAEEDSSLGERIRAAMDVLVDHGPAERA